MQKYYKSLTKNIGEQVNFAAKTYAESFEQGGDGKWYPKFSKYGEYCKSTIPEICASKNIGGAILGNWTASGMPKKKKFFIYELQDEPDYDISQLDIADFKVLQEVRYRKHVSGKFIGEYNKLPEVFELFYNYYYYLLSEDGGMNKHYELLSKFEEEYGYNPFDQNAPKEGYELFNKIQDKFWEDLHLDMEKTLNEIHKMFI